ncbi:DUF2591 domain-containing protein [Trinickia dabaoshanensis]|uniref:DUF2591 domain-containing protein n=1 Tax=Trinickia dabaoshanensis TaxID=564714 RepID=A0A2N7VB73_9BURK|nr:phage protein NinX family protein [Trinickia dabaoshanensis]PMS14389.1 DUF2591 domain-containing protein [Trinickia dabaoshanensis]
MNTSELQGCELDYWCARALVDGDELIEFIQVEPSVVVTLTHGALRKLAQPFSPAGEWSDALEVLERAQELQWKRDERGAHCKVRFEGADSSEADAEHPRVALLRAFVLARFGQTVGDRPTMPHAVREGKVSPYDAGGVPPTYGDNVGAGDEIGNIRSVPRP